jgi:hypothetical protein
MAFCDGLLSDQAGLALHGVGFLPPVESGFGHLEETVGFDITTDLSGELKNIPFESECESLLDD